jgi:hypothetical protein
MVVFSSDPLWLPIEGIPLPRVRSLALEADIEVGLHEQLLITDFDAMN